MKRNTSVLFPFTGTGSDVQTPKRHLQRKPPSALGTDPSVPICRPVPGSDASANDATASAGPPAAAGAQVDAATSAQGGALRAAPQTPGPPARGGRLAEEAGAVSRLEDSAVPSAQGEGPRSPGAGTTPGTSGGESVDEKQGPPDRTESCQGQTEPLREREQTENNCYKHKSKTKHSVAEEGTQEKRLGPKRKPKSPKSRRDAKFEGTRIPHLVRKRQYRRQGHEDGSESKQQSSDDYVLAKLFRKSGNPLLSCRGVLEAARAGRSNGRLPDSARHWGFF